MSDAAGPVRIALVGCGRISRNHLDAIEKVDGIELAATCGLEVSRVSVRDPTGRPSRT